jgi:hypothetical protein
MAKERAAIVHLDKSDMTIIDVHYSEIGSYLLVIRIIGTRTLFLVRSSHADRSIPVPKRSWNQNRSSFRVRQK